MADVEDYGVCARKREREEEEEDEGDVVANSLVCFDDDDYFIFLRTLCCDVCHFTRELSLKNFFY